MTDLLEQCAASGQLSAAQIAAHSKAGELAIAADPIGVEAALPIQYLGKEPEPFDWQALVLWIAVVVCFASVVALSIADPRDLSTLWPRLVAAVSL